MEQETSSSKPKVVRRTSEEIQAIIAEYEKGGLSAKAFCKLHHIKKDYLTRWITRYGNKKGLKGFVPVSLPVMTPGQERTLFAEYRGIKFYQKVDASYLKSLLS
jgi:hypothetical protein